MKDFKVTLLDGKYYLTLTLRENGELKVKSMEINNEYAAEVVEKFGLETENLNIKDLT